MNRLTELGKDFQNQTSPVEQIPENTTQILSSQQSMNQGTSAGLSEGGLFENISRDDEQQIKSIVQGFAIPAFVIDGNHKVILWNRALEELSKIKGEEIIGTGDHWKAFYSQKRPCMADILIDGGADDIEKWYTGKYKKSLLINDSFEATDFFPNLGTNGRWLRFTATVIKNNSGDLLGVLETLEDISEYKRAELSLKESEKKYRHIFNFAGDGIVLLDITGRIVELNDMAVAIFAENRDEIIGKHFKDLDFLSSKDIPMIIKNFSLMMSGESVEVNLAIKNRKEEVKYLECSSSTIVQSDKETSILVIVRDVTKRKQTEEELQQSEARFRLAISSISDILYEWDVKTGSIQWFGDIDSKLGYEHGVFPRTLEAFLQHIHVEDVEAVKAAASHGLQSHQKWMGEYRIHNKLGIERYWYGTGIGIYNEDGTPIKVVGAVTDITERKCAENALRRSEEKYRLVTENATDVIWTMNMDLRFTYVSPSTDKMMGYPSQKVIDLSLDQILTAESVELVMDTFAREMQLEQSGDKNFSRYITLELNEIRADGTIFPIEVRMSFLRDVNNNPIGIIGITRDITERKKQQDALKKSEEKFIKAFRSSPVAMAITRISDGRFLEVNNALEKLIGYTRDELLAQTTLGLNIWVDISDRKHLFEELNKVGSVFDYEYRFRSKNGNVIFTRYSGELIDFSGDTSVLSVLIDITQQKDMEKSLKESEEKYRNIVENTKDVIMLTNPDGVISYISPACVHVLEYTAEDLVGKIPEIFYSEDIEKVHTALSNALKGVSGSNLEYRIVTKNGKTKWVSHSWSPIWTENHEMKYIVSVVRDISESKNTEQNLKEKIQELEKYKMITVNREVKMVDLKNEINELYKQLNLKPKYPNV